ncbi:MAG: enoyl-CoA hydratase [Acidimicrobiales bacterium]
MIHATHDGPVAMAVLDRPDRRNALDHDHCEQLAAAVWAAVEAGARVLVLAGEGPHFCAGADLSGVEDEGFVAALHHALEALATAPIPTIAAVQGAALGAGTQLAIACDLRMALPDARFGIPAARLGLMVDHWTIARLSAVIGSSPAAAMLVAAQEYDGEAAHRLGMVHRLGDRAAALAWAAQIATLAPLTMAGHKIGLREGGAAYEAAFHAAWSSRDLQEAMTARREKRSPRFEGR